MGSLTIHIGHHKAGSSYIQFILSKVDGVYYDRRLPTLLAKEQKNKVVLDWYEMILKEHNHKDIFLSNEHLIGELVTGYRHDYFRERIAKLFPEARVFMVIRNQSSILPSLYRESVRSRFTYRDFKSWLEGGFNPDKLNYYRQYLGYSKAYGNKFNVFVFEEIESDHIAFIRGIVQFMGIDFDRVSPHITNEVINKKLDMDLIRAFRILNFFESVATGRLNILLAYMERKDLIKKRRIRGPFYHFKRYILNRMKNYPNPSWSAQMVISSMRKIGNPAADFRVDDKILERYREPNRRLGEAIGIDLGKYGYPT